MISIFGKNYFIDMNELDKFLHIEPKTPTSGDTETFSVIKFEVVKTLIEVILTEREDIDENLGTYSAKNLSIPFKFAFNTLLVYNILKEI
jgi:hypothetical protein